MKGFAKMLGGKASSLKDLMSKPYTKESASKAIKNRVIAKMSSHGELKKAEKGEKSIEQHKADWQKGGPYKSASQAISHPSFDKMHKAINKKKNK